MYLVCVDFIPSDYHISSAFTVNSKYEVAIGLLLNFVIKLECCGEYFGDICG